MAADAAMLARVQRSGMGVLQPATGMAALAALMGARSPAVFSAVPVHWAALLRGPKAPPPFFADFAPAAPALSPLPGKLLSGIRMQVRCALSLEPLIQNNVCPEFALQVLSWAMLGGLSCATTLLLCWLCRPPQSKKGWRRGS